MADLVEKIDRLTECSDAVLYLIPKEEKATRAAIRFLTLRGGSMSHLKLLKLLYMADRTPSFAAESQFRWTASQSMKHGPVLSNIYNLLVEVHLCHSIWSRYISAPDNHELTLIRQDYPDDRLSPAGKQLIDEVFGTFGSMGRWDLVGHLHETLPEWKNPGETSVPISVKDILSAEIEGEAEIAEIEDELAGLSRPQARVA